jgi:hypothetical protein
MLIGTTHHQTLRHITLEEATMERVARTLSHATHDLSNRDKGVVLMWHEKPLWRILSRSLSLGIGVVAQRQHAQSTLSLPRILDAMLRHKHTLIYGTATKRCMRSIVCPIMTSGAYAQAVVELTTIAHHTIQRCIALEDNNTIGYNGSMMRREVEILAAMHILGMAHKLHNVGRGYNIEAQFSLLAPWLHTLE